MSSRPSAIIADSEGMSNRKSHQEFGLRNVDIIVPGYLSGVMVRMGFEVDMTVPVKLRCDNIRICATADLYGNRIITSVTRDDSGT